MAVRCLVAGRKSSISHAAAGKRTHVYYELSIVLEMNSHRTSSSEVVSMMQAAERRHGNDIRIRRRALHGPSLSRRLLAQPEMRPILVVIADVFVHQPFQMVLVEHDDMVGQVAATTPHEALSHAVLPWTLKAGSLGFDAKTLDRFHDICVEIAATVED